MFARRIIYWEEFKFIERACKSISIINRNYFQVSEPLLPLVNFVSAVPFFRNLGSDAVHYYSIVRLKNRHTNFKKHERFH